MTGVRQFGIDAQWLDGIRAVFRAYPPVEKAWIYGSRARGDFRPESDIDIAVDAPGLDSTGFSRLWNDLDDLPHIFKTDVVHLDTLSDGSLKDSIRTEGVAVYAKNELK
jgi:proline iminopeptidase